LRAKGHDRIIVSNDPVNFFDPWGLWSLWGGGSVVGAAGAGGTLGAGVAYDSNNGGVGDYGAAGPAYGVAGSAGVEAGFYTGDLVNASQVYTVGLFDLSLGFVWGEDGWGLVGGFSPLGLPFELSYSEPHTTFEPIPLFAPETCP